MQVNLGEDLIVKMLYILTGKEIILKAIVSIVGRDEPPKNRT